MSNSEGDYRLKHFRKVLENKYKELSVNEDLRSQTERELSTATDPKIKVRLKHDILEYEEKEKKIKAKIEEICETIQKIENNEDSDDVDKKYWQSSTTENSDYVENERSSSDVLNSGVIELFGDRSSSEKNFNVDYEFSSQLTRLKSQFEKGAKIENIILYVATFFEGLSPYEFNQVISILIKDMTTEIKNQSKFINEEGKEEFIEERETKLLLEIWKDDLGRPDKYLKACQLKSLEHEGSRIIDFIQPELRAMMKNYLKEEQPLYAECLFEKTHLFMFHPLIQIAKGGLTVTTDAMLTHPTIYNETWISKLVDNLTEKESWDINDNLNLLQKIQKYLNQIEAASNREIVFKRISGLLYFMLGNTSLQATVKKFINELMSNKRYDAVTFIIDELDHVNEFDSLYWIKRILDSSGDQKAVSKAYRSLYRKLKSSGFRLYEILEELYLWLPDKGLPASRYSPSSIASISILVDYCSGTIANFSEDDYGSYPSRYRLFQPFTRGQADEKIKIIISYLFHPSENNTLAIDHVLENDLDAISFLGRLVAEWFMILYGLDNKQKGDLDLKDLNDIIIKTLFQEIVLCCDDRKCQELSQFWAQLNGDYLDRINRLPITESSVLRKSKKRLTRRRNAVRHLSKQFKRVSKEYSA